MKYHVYPALILAIIISLFSAMATATHQTDEKYDDSIYSFRWLKNPIGLGKVQIRDQKGNQIGLSQFSGKIVLLNLWATWCAPCVKELPALDRLQQHLGGKDFDIIAVSIDSEPDLATKMFNDMSIEHLPFYRETPEAMGRYFPVDVLPTSILIDRENQAIALLRSSLDWDKAESIKLINRLIAGVSVATLKAENAQHITAE